MNSGSEFPKYVHVTPNTTVKIIAIAYYPGDTHTYTFSHVCPTPLFASKRTEFLFWLPFHSHCIRIINFPMASINISNKLNSLRFTLFHSMCHSTLPSITFTMYHMNGLEKLGRGMVVEQAVIDCINYKTLCTFRQTPSILSILLAFLVEICKIPLLGNQLLLSWVS